MQAEDSEVFLLYNEREKLPDTIATELRTRGVSLYFYRSDLPLGGKIKDTEAERLRSARGVVALLGDRGWGVSQAELAQEADSLGKPILPVLIGNPPDEAMDQVGRLFRERRRLDLREPSPALYDELVSAIQNMTVSPTAPKSNPLRSTGPRFDEIINTLVDGSDLDRSLLLERIIRYPVPNSAELATRLRHAINEDFSPAQETQFATAVRAPKRLASARSWMLSTLIWLEPLSPDSQTVIFAHLQASLEPDREVRFWTLAGIVQRKLPYLSDALALATDDPAQEISGLAAIVSNPSNESTLTAFRSSLGDESFEIAWHVLRILRIVAVPNLAFDVVRQLDRRAEDKSLTYDALFALANPEMARAAVPVILERPGLERFVALVLQEARSATAIARSAFARTLSAFDDAQARAALDLAAEGAEDEKLVQRILDDIAEIQDKEDLSEPPIAGFWSDTIDISHDDIGITKDVETLACVMLARKVTPPLAIGLFGEWGSGKSFFMKSIEAAATRISNAAKAEKSDQFCGDIVQINFNAWHYADANLWASLVSHLLDGLSRHLAPAPSAAQKQAVLAGELASAKAEMAAAQSERERATLHLEETARTLQDKIIERERREIRLRDLRAADLMALLKDDKALDDQVKAALKRVGAPAALESIGELNKVVEESYSTAGRATAFLVSLLTGRNVLLVFLGIAVFFIAPPLIEWALREALNAYAGAISAMFAKVTVVAGSLTLVLRTAVAKAKRLVDERLAAKRATPSPEEEELEKGVLDAKASEKAAIDRLSAASARAQDLESRVALLKESQSLGYFVAQRSSSEDYRRHLGLISMIRKDFDGLVERLKSVENQQGRQVDRIILYIDDVDRCPPDMVVDILQAVHLLLAYELFVVVVSVDPRWLLRSLESRFTTLQADKNAEMWGAAPQDYLEKIFQIPFSVRPMGDRGFTRLMDRLLPASTPASQPEPIPTGPADEPTTINSHRQEANDPETAQQAPSSPSQTPSAVSEPDSGQSPAPETSEPPSALGMLAEALAISKAEAQFARTLSRFLPTPRGAKRFANIYRLLKASLPRNQLAGFEGSETVPGDFQLPMLLLALLVGHSKAATHLFPQFLDNARLGGLTWWSSDDSGQLAYLAKLRAQLDDIVSAPLFPSDPSLVVSWLPRVARYSFTTARMFLSEAERSAGHRASEPISTRAGPI
jgi:hypothetical protein